MLTCLYCPVAAESLQRWLLVLLLFFTEVCVHGIRVPFPLCVNTPLFWCPCADVQLDIEAWGWHLTSSLTAHHWTWCLLIPASLACQFALGDPSFPILGTGVPGRRHVAQLPCIYGGPGDANSDLRLHMASALPTELPLGPTPVTTDC